MVVKAFNWYGGKLRVVLEILSCIPWYITDWYEACMGSAVVTLNSVRHRVEVISDMDEDLVHLFSMLADRVDGANLVDRLMGLQYSESEFIRAMRAKNNHYKTVDDFRRAEMIYIAITQSFNSTRKGFRRRGISQRDYTFMSQCNLPEVHQRLQGVRVYQMDCVEVVRKVHNNPNAFVFLDVPYRWELRAKGACNIYGHEMDTAHHIKLLEVCRDAKCCIMLCGYRQTDGNDLYDNYLGVGLPESPWKQYTLAELVKACQTTDSKKKDCYRSVEELPLVLTPMDVAGIMGISKNTAYEVVHSKGFPTIRVGKQYRIPRDKFLHWLDSVEEVQVA